MKKKTSYIGNVVKEVKQTAKSASNAVDKYLNGNRPLPKGMKIGPSNVKKEAGQLAGALLQGRRYDESGKQIVAGKGGSARRTAQSPTGRTRGTITPMPKKTAIGTKPRGGKPMPKAKKTAIGVKPRGGRPLKKSM
jgi:hypothetical protein